jgi:prepilin-type N-terminal cleavage/methylation domain-containing protein
MNVRQSKQSSPVCTTRPGFTLVELLVVIAIIGVLVGMLAPAVQSIRETSRRAACQSKLIPIGLAIQSYHDRWMHFPVGTVLAPEDGISGPIASTAVGNHHNWLGRLMDLMDQPAVANRIDRSVSVYDEANQPVLQLRLPVFRCPSSDREPDNASNYVGLHHPTEKAIDESDHGVFLLNVAITRDDVTDGLANTAFVSEKLLSLEDLGWLSGTRATLRNVGSGIETNIDRFAKPVASAVGSVGSRHPTGAHFLFGSGEVRFQASDTDPRILEQIVDRRDGQLPMQFQSIETLREQSLE